MEPLPPAHIPVTRMMKKPGKCGPAICTGGKEEYGFFWARRNFCHSSIQWHSWAFYERMWMFSYMIGVTVPSVFYRTTLVYACCLRKNINCISFPPQKWADLDNNLYGHPTYENKVPRIRKVSGRIPNTHLFVKEYINLLCCSRKNISFNMFPVLPKWFLTIFWIICL